MPTTAAPPRPIWQRAIMLGAPLALALLTLLFHGTEELLRSGAPDADAWVAYLTTIPTRWIVLHLVLLPLFPALGLALFWMLPPTGRARQVSMLFIAAYVTLYPAFDALVGLGSGVLLQHRAGLPPAEQAVLDAALKRFFFDSGSVAFWLAAAASLAWGFAVATAAAALWRPAGRRVAIPLLVAGVALSVDHAPPFGVIAGLAFALAAWQFLARPHAARTGVTVDASLTTRG